MPFFSAKNLVSQELSICVPWEFQPTETITEQIRHDKEERQSWYQNQATSHQFYSGIEPLNPNLRISKEANPPLIIHALTADYDLPLPEERIDEAIKSMGIKPCWVERSLSGNARLIWVLEEPMRLDGYAFAAFILERAQKWLSLGLLPGLDEAAFNSPTRLYCNGCNWRATSHKPVPLRKSQSFLVEAAKHFRWPATEEMVIPLDVVEKQLKVVYPGMDWPEAFAVDTQGPSFWVPESTSPQSAIVKSGGMFSFSAHAERPFTPWSDPKLLGAEFCKEFQSGAITKATAGTFFDSKKYWQKIGEEYYPTEAREFTLHLKVTCRLSAKPGPSGVSPVEDAMEHIHKHSRIKAALPFAFRPPGPLRFNGDYVLNTYTASPIKPAEGAQKWGIQGNFPFLSAHFDTFFLPVAQLAAFLAWFRHYYMSALHCEPRPGQNTILMGGVSVGKTFTNRFIVGTAVGGFVDASDFLVENITFNSHLFKRGHWVLDDETPSNSAAGITRMSSILKKLAANQQFTCNEKFQVAGNLEWMGRIGITANLDFVSSRILAGLDNNSLDKTNLFRCPAVRPDFVFPDRYETSKIIERELPYFLRWLVDWVVPVELKTDPRYGFVACHEQSLLDQGYQTSPTAGFKECLVKALSLYFEEKPEDQYYSGSVSDIICLMKGSSGEVLRSIRLEQANRYLEQIQRENIMEIATETGLFNVRLWKFKNFRPPVVPAVQPPPADTTPATPNPFQK